MVKFEWDEAKNQINILKHGISFQEAVTVFDDEEALIVVDEEHSYDEDRFIITGFSKKENLLVVCHCYRENDEVIRIISARKAVPHDRKSYIEQYEKH